MKAKKSESNIKFLVKVDCNWADEADLEGFALYEPKAWEYVCKEIEASVYPIEWCWGSNQWVEFETPDDVFRCFDVSVLSTEETDFLEKRLIKYGEFGFTPFGSLEGNAPEEFYKENGNFDDYVKKGDSNDG